MQMSKRGGVIVLGLSIWQFVCVVASFYDARRSRVLAQDAIHQAEVWRVALDACAGQGGLRAALQTAPAAAPSREKTAPRPPSTHARY
jgi:hypothetical protein